MHPTMGEELAIRLSLPEVGPHTVGQPGHGAELRHKHVNLHQTFSTHFKTYVTERGKIRGL